MSARAPKIEAIMILLARPPNKEKILPSMTLDAGRVIELLSVSSESLM
jgi:hypothetical protein